MNVLETDEVRSLQLRGCLSVTRFSLDKYATYPLSAVDVLHGKRN